ENPNTMFVGYKNVWRCNNVKAPTGQISWDKISDNLAGSNSSNMAVLEQSPADLNILYAARYDSRLFRSDNVNDPMPSWNDITSYMPENMTPTDVEAHPFLPGVVYMTQNNRVYKSSDRGYNWEDISGTLPNVHLSSIAFYKNSQDGLYIGSDAGVFYRDSSMDDWIWFNNGLPVDASVNEIEIYYHPDSVSGDVIRAGTYGRGLWSSDMYYAEPEAAFIASDTLIPPGCAIDFTDLSSGVPHFWEWTFEGGFPGTSTDKDPAGVIYNTPGTYSVSLTAWNSAGTSSVTYTHYITVSETLMPVTAFTVNDSVPCFGNTLYFTDKTLHCPSSWRWMFIPDDVTFLEGTNEYSQNPVVELNQAGAYSVTLIAENANGSDTKSKPDYILHGGYSIPFAEDFESGLDAKSWTVINPDRGITWGIHEVAGTTPGNHATWMNLFDYYSLYPRDYLVSPPMNFTGFNNLSLTFEHAYAQRYSQVDSLIVAVSGDCGETWTRIYVGYPDGQGSFETSEPTTEFFLPQSEDDWCGQGYGALCNVLDLSQWAGHQNIKIRFETVGKYGNNLYIDNVEISNSVSVGENLITGDLFTVFPNPSDGSFTIRMNHPESSLQVELLNMESQRVFTKTISGLNGNYSETIDLSNLSSGIYILKASGNQTMQVEKIIIR
ncbi:MAG: PKD domain-containing protein, partial [Bacteroidetes bacterium]|nr:PKD domain-containing protein [Bacteroidota bacterium]